MDWRGSSRYLGKCVLIQSRRQKFCESAAARSDWLANLFFLQVRFVFAGVEVVGNLLSTMAHCSIVHRARHAKRAHVFNHRSVGDLRVRLTGRKFWKKLDTASRFESFFSLSLERERIAAETAHGCRYTGASVFGRRQKFCESAARLDGLAELGSRSNGVEGQIEPEMKTATHVLTRVE